MPRMLAVTEPACAAWSRTIAALFVLTLCILNFSALFLPQSAAAVTATIRPTADGVIDSAWSSTGSTYYTSINQVVTQPTTPSIATSISISSKVTGKASFAMGSISTLDTATAVTIWAYHNDGGSTAMTINLMDSTETTTYGSGTLPANSANSWTSVSISGLSLSASALNSMHVQLNSPSSGGKTHSQYVYALYADVTYTIPPYADIVNASDVSVPSPSFAFSTVQSSFACQNSTATLGSSSQQIRMYNSSSDPNWTLSLAATGGASASWSNGTQQFDYNDSAGAPAGCVDGADTDSNAGQLTIDSSAGVITSQSGCSATGVSKGASASFAEGSVDSITLMSASNAALNCYWSLTGDTMTQTIPPAIKNGSYTLNLTMTATAT